MRGLVAAGPLDDASAFLRHAQGFGEIAFCAVTANEQVKGFGTRLMNYTKASAASPHRDPLHTEIHVAFRLYVAHR